jgi:hypothetical protein
MVELVGGQPFVPQDVEEDAGVEVAGAGAHHQPAGRREAHRGVHAPAACDRRQTGTGAQVREDHLAAGRFVPRLPAQLVHQVRERQAVEAVPLDSGLPIARGERIPRGPLGEVAVEAGVEADDLPHPGQAVRDGLDQAEFERQVVRGEGDRPSQVREQVRRHELRAVVIRTAVDDAMPDSRHPAQVAGRVQPVEQPCGGLRRVGGGQGPAVVRATRHVDAEGGVGVADSLDSPSQYAAGRIGRGEHRELDARRPGVEHEEPAVRGGGGVEGRHRRFLGSGEAGHPMS